MILYQKKVDDHAPESGEVDVEFAVGRDVADEEDADDDHRVDGHDDQPVGNLCGNETRHFRRQNFAPGIDGGFRNALFRQRTRVNRVDRDFDRPRHELPGCRQGNGSGRNGRGRDRFCRNRPNLEVELAGDVFAGWG